MSIGEVFDVLLLGDEAGNVQFFAHFDSSIV